MPDFAIIPELPAGYPINGRRSVARIVSVQTVVVSQTPTVAFPATETWMITTASLTSLPIVGPSDVPAQDLSAPSVPVAVTESASAGVRIA